MEMADLSHRIEQLTLRLVNCRSVVATADEIVMSELVYQLLAEMPYWKQHPELLVRQPFNNDPLGRFSVVARLEGSEAKERQQMLLEYGLPSAESIRDRSISLFTRGRWRFNSGTFLNTTYMEDMRELGDQDVVIIGAPYDGGTTFRPGTRFGPQAMRRISPRSRRRFSIRASRKAKSGRRWAATSSACSAPPCRASELAVMGLAR